MRRWIKRIVLIFAAWAMGGATAFAQVGAVGDGNWNTGSTWTTGTVPGASDTVYVGSTYPSGSASTATVTVSDSEAAYQLFLGYSTGDSGTIDLTSGGTLAVTYLYLGYSGGVGAISETGGSFTAGYAYVYNGSSLNFGASDAVTSYLQLNSSSATTTATGNLTGSVYLNSGSTLSLGANLSLSSTLDVEDTGSVVHMNGNNISASTILLGWYDGQTVTLDRGTTPGSLTASYLYVGPNNTLTMLAADSTTDLNLSAATVTTAATSNVTGSVSVANGSTLNLGADLTLSSTLDVEQTGSVVHMNGHNISAYEILLGWDSGQAVTLDRGTTPGSLSATYLFVYGQTLDLLPSDTITNFYLNNGTTTLNNNVAVSYLQLENGSTGTTTSASNISGSVNVYSGSTLNLGANLTLTGNLDVEDTGSVVHMNGNNISASTILLGWYDGQTVTLDRGTTPGSLTASYLYVGPNNTLTMVAADSTSSLNLSAATVTTAATSNVTGSVSVANGSTLNLGADLTLSSTLDVEQTGSVVHMNGHNISAYEILLGWDSGQAVTLDRGTTPGSLSATYLFVYGQTLDLLPSDTITNFYLNNGTTTLNNNVAVSYLQLENGSTGTTTSASNISGSVNVYSGSTLNLGANLTLTGNLDVEDTGSVVHMNGNNISASTILLGWYDGQAVTLDRGTTPGSLTASYLYVGPNNTLTMLAADSTTDLNLSAATVTTATTSNVTGSVSVANGSTLNLGADLTLSSTLDVEQTGSVVHMNGHNISAYEILLGWDSGQAVTLDRGTTPGSLSATYLFVYGQTLNLLPSDTITNFYLSNGTTTLNNNVAVSTLYLEGGSTATTTSTNNISGNVSVLSGSTLNLGANLNLSGSLDVEDTGSVVHMNGNNISAGTILLGWYDGQAVTLDRGTTPGSLTATYLYVGANTTLNMVAADATTNLYVNGTVTTAATGNVTGDVEAYNGGTLNLGANLNLTSSLDIYGGATVNAHGFGITAYEVLVGYNGSTAASLINTGLVTTNYLLMGNGSALTLHGGDVVNTQIILTGGSTLTVQQTNGIGLTLNGAFTTALTIDPSSMDLIFNLNTAPNWDFRWADPTNGNWISTLEAMIADGQIVINAPQGYSIVDDGTYTYIDGGFSPSAVPEPSSLVLACIAGVSVAIGVRWKRRRTGC